MLRKPISPNLYLFSSKFDYLVSYMYNRKKKVREHSIGHILSRIVTEAVKFIKGMYYVC